MNRVPVARGYAMLLVLLVLLILALSMGTLVWHLSANIAETRRIVTTIRASAGAASTLDAAGRSITGTFKTDPSADPETLLNEICKKPGADCNDTTSTGAILPRHLTPVGIDLVDFNILTIRQRSPTTRRIDGGPFIERLAVEEAILVVAAVQDERTGRRAIHTDRYVVPSLPITNFALFGAAPTTRWSPPFTIRRQNDSYITTTCNPASSQFNGCGSRIHVNGNLGGLTTTDFPLPTSQVATDQPHINLTTSTRGTDQILRPRVAAPAMSTKQDGYTGGTQSFRWLVEPPRSTDTTTQRMGRLATQADIVIIDGVWYLNIDKTQPWPGKPIFSEHGGSSFGIPDPADDVVASTANVGIGDLGFAAGEFPKLYSWYDRQSATDPVREQVDSAQGDRGVISYGPLEVTTTTTTCTTDADCDIVNTGRECYRATTGTGVCISMEPGSWSGTSGGGIVTCDGKTGFNGVSQCDSDEVRTIVDGTRTGFSDNGKRILPINFSVREFTRALKSTSPNELGAIIGSRFNGIVYITTRFPTADYPAQALPDDGSSMPAAICYKDFTTGNGGFSKCPGKASAQQPSTFDPITQHVVPVGLCSDGVKITGSGANDFGEQPCATASRPNAVRVYQAGVVDPTVFTKGLTIVTDLPLYAYGDVNRVQTNQPHMKVALVADRVTFQSRGWRDRFHPWFDTTGLDAAARDALLGAGATEPATGVQVLETSLITGVPMRNGGIHDIGDVFRTPQAWNQNFFILRGHIVAGFNSEWFRDIGNNNDVDDDGRGDPTNDEGDDVRTVADGLRWLPDFHLDNPAFQPPGMPLVSLPPTSRYRQQF